MEKGRVLMRAKRLFDLMLVIPFLVSVLPVLLCLILLIRYKFGSPVFFRQLRPGKNCCLFEMVKFRTMTNSKDENGNLLPDADRLTPFGKFLRSSSLDELPELWNVLKGDMSFVGPRPLLVEYITLYNSEQMRRHDVHPGITGWAQVNGRNAISWEEKFDLDVWYVDNHTLWLDIKILFLTVIKVFFRQGINQKGQATMERFTGSVCK